MVAWIHVAEVLVSDSGSILKVKSIKHTDGLDIGNEREESRMSSRLSS